jgi:hypothetical protein
MTEFDPFEMCRILNEEKVEYVVLGGFAAVLRGSPVTTRDFGDIDLTFTPAGSTGEFAGWKLNATSELIAEGLIVSVASLDDIIDSKKTANRAKDHLSLPYLESLREELRRQSNE